MLAPMHRAAFVGMTRSGKTSFLRDGVIPGIASYVIYDPDFQFDKYAGPPHRARIVNNINDFKRLFPIYPRLVFQPRDEIAADYDLLVMEFEEICDLINKQGRDMTFIVDEIGVVTVKRRMAQVPRNFRMMIQRRQKEPYNIGVYFTTQRPQHSCVDLLSQCQHIYAFKLLSHDIDYVEHSFPIKIDHIVASMEQYACLHYDVLNSKVTMEKMEKGKGGFGGLSVLADMGRR